jgi:hypothetical protein
MTTLFFLLGIFPMMWELSVMVDIDRSFNIVTKIRTLKKGDPQYIKILKDYSLFIILMVLYCLWTFIGLATSQWPLFLLVILISLIPKKIKWLFWLDAMISFCILLFILLNKFHFHVDVLHLIFKK